MNTTTPVRVGFLGAGPVTQAIHLPTLARLGDAVTVTRIMDVDPDVARVVAERADAAWTTDEADVIAAADVDVVVVCSPDRFHAGQVVAACEAGKRVVLCEKPLTVTHADAQRIAAASASTGVPLIVGTMHVYDPGWRTAQRLLDFAPHTVNSSIVLPPNPVFEDAATQMAGRVPHTPAGVLSAQAQADAVVGGILGLAIHDLPLIRTLLRRHTDDRWRRLRVLSARHLAPFGYLIVIDAGGTVVELHSVMGDDPVPDWRLTAVGDASAIDVRFTPSYVHAGSATVTVHAAAGSTTSGPTDVNGYEAEWRHVVQVATGEADATPADVLVDDIEFALDIARQARSLILAGADARPEAGA